MFTHPAADIAGNAVTEGGTQLPFSIVYPVPRWFGISMMFGLLICVLVFATGSISGGNLNPAVTLSLALTRKMSVLRAFSYIAAQCLGSIIGAAFAQSLSPDLFKAAGGAANIVDTSSSWSSLWTVLGGEILGTFLLVFTVCTAADAGRERANKYVGALTPLAIGFAVLNVHLFLIPVDGCSINPARSLGSAVVYNEPVAWKDHWVFWVGPFVGGPAAALLYEFIFAVRETSAPDTPKTPAPQRVTTLDSVPSRPIDAGAAAVDVAPPRPARAGPIRSGSTSPPTILESMSNTASVPLPSSATVPEARPTVSSSSLTAHRAAGRSLFTPTGAEAAPAAAPQPTELAAPPPPATSRVSDW